MPKPVCIPCQRFFRVKKNGFYFTEGAPSVPKAPPGTAAPEQWRPYKVWAADLYECQGCGAQILSGFGREFYETTELGDDNSNWWGPTIPCVLGMLRAVGLVDVTHVGRMSDRAAFSGRRPE